MHESNAPKVSICIPTFNGARYLRQAIDSVIEQRLPDFEILIIDNCSTDQTSVLINDFLKNKEARIRFYRNERNIGLVANFNKCLEYARGRYIKFLCADDFLLPGSIAQMISALEVHPSVTLVCGGRLSINQKGKHLALRRYSSRTSIIQGNKVITKCLFGGNFIGEPTAVMFRKQDMNGFFREDLSQLMDMEMWFRLLEQGHLLSLEQPVCTIRKHHAQTTNTNIKSGILISDNVTVFNDYSGKPYLETTLPLKMQHKLLMTYRLWVSRHSVSKEQRKTTLRRYGVATAYPLMSLVWFLRALRNGLFR